jgi:hypothetical protein
MNPRLMVICLGGLAGAGAVVCCDLDEGLDELEAVAEGEGVEADASEPEAGPTTQGDGAVVH